LDEGVWLTRLRDVRIDAQELASARIVVAADYGAVVDAKIGSATLNGSVSPEFLDMTP
jgi:hypothetical protein